MNLILLGLPGAGKGTQAKKISQKYKLSHIATGDMFRRAIEKKTFIGKQVKDLIEAGQLVPDEITIQLVKARLEEEDCHSGFILDGFPRTLKQAEILPEILEGLGKEINSALYIDVNPEDLISRILGRRSCTNCGASYNLDYNQPEIPGECNQCGSKLIQRSDDSEETVKMRIMVNQRRMKEILDYYQEQGLLKTVDGNIGMNRVFSRIKEIIEAKIK